MSKKSFVRKLPGYFQTASNQKFFSATVDQLYCKRDSTQLNGYIGRRIGGQYDPLSDFFLPEISKDRTWRQLEPAAFSVNQDTLEKTNVMFYDDVVNFVAQYGGDVGNHSRLFESDTYSFSPPIDCDKFINYQNYYWLPDRLPVISVLGMTDADVETLVIGNPHFNTNQIAVTPADLEFSSGLRVRFIGSASYDLPLTVEGVGDSMLLVEDLPEVVPESGYAYLGWSQITTIGNTIYDNSLWDSLPWGGVRRALGDDYITIERGSNDMNAWSRSNKWYHVDVVNTAIDFTNTMFPLNAIVAQRPIIEFKRDLEMFRAGTTFKTTVDYALDINFADVDGALVLDVNAIAGVTIIDGETMIFPTSVGNDALVYVASVVAGVISLAQMSYLPSNGDVVFPTEGVHAGETYYHDGVWVPAYYQKTGVNQTPRFNLYDHSGASLDNEFKYPGNDFRGSEVFSYKVNSSQSAISDPVLGFPLSYKTTGTASDIIFENDLAAFTYRYLQADEVKVINGHYFFRKYSTTDGIDPAGWYLRASWEVSSTSTSQRVVDRYVVGYDSRDSFPLSVTPRGFVDGSDHGNVLVMINGSRKTVTYADFSVKNGIIHYEDTSLVAEDVVELRTVTSESLSEDARGYDEIPSQWEDNPNNDSVVEYSAGELTSHFTSIIRNQSGFVGVALGGPNNFRDTLQDGSAGDVIVQHDASLLRSALLMSDDDLNVLSAIRYSQSEYNKFKSKYLKTTQQMINRQFTPASAADDVIVDEWFDEIMRAVIISKEFSNSFAYSNMVARGDVYVSENFTVDGTLSHLLATPADLNDPSVTLYLYALSPSTSMESSSYHMSYPSVMEIHTMLVDGVDYRILPQNDSNDPITIELLTQPAGTQLLSRLYSDSAPSYIPSTPSKLGCYPSFQPRIELDDTFLEPTWVIVGHDGSKTTAFGTYDAFGNVLVQDIRDLMILELERRIYNGIDPKFKDSYTPRLIANDVVAGEFRATDYTIKEVNDIVAPSFIKWATKNKLDFITNDYYDVSEWKTWNYSSLLDPLSGKSFNGHWKGVYLHYYDTYRPHVAPWEMLGFSTKPTWWESTYGTNYASTNTAMWGDITQGINASTGEVDQRYVRQTAQVPVSASGELIDLPTLFGVASSAPSGGDAQWVFGDNGPVEDSWRRSVEFPYAVMEMLFLTKPARFGEAFWNPASLVFDAGGLVIDANTNERRSNKTLTVHGENVNGVIVRHTGVEVLVADRISQLGKNVTASFGDKIRSLSLNLGYRVGGFTNSETLRVFLDGANPESTSNSLQIPVNNYQVKVHTGQTVATYAYSGVVIRVIDGKFTVYGYDLLNLSFKILGRKKNAKSVHLNEAGDVSDFEHFSSSSAYGIGSIVRYNSVFYSALSDIPAGQFNSPDWQKLPRLPVVGGVTVSYVAEGSDEVITVPYGTVMPDVQAVFDFLIGLGDYQAAEGWVFNSVNGSNQVSDWYNSAREFLFWVSSDWSNDSALFLSPLADGTDLLVSRGYPSNVERLSNGVYSILNKYGAAIMPVDTTVERQDQRIQVIPKNDDEGIFFARITTTETEHILLLDNITEFNDVVFDPVLGIRQNRLRFSGRKTNGWYGKFEAPGYLIIGDRLMPNFDNMVESMRYYYDSDVQLDNTIVEDAARHLIGYEAKEYLSNLELVDDRQYQFYQGFIRDKGTQSGLTRILRSDHIQLSDSTDIYEEWAFKVGEFGGQSERVQMDFVIQPNDVQSNPQTVRLNHLKSSHGYISEVIAFSVGDVYTSAPMITISPPTGVINAVQATAVATLAADGRIESITMLNQGSGYESTPTVTITRSDALPVTDQMYGVYHANIEVDVSRDEIIDIDIDDTDMWITRPQSGTLASVGLTDHIDYQLPNAGYVHRLDVDHAVFDTTALYALVAKSTTLSIGDTIWVAKRLNESWDVLVCSDIGAFSNLSAIGTGPADSDKFTKVSVDFSAFFNQEMRYFEATLDYTLDNVMSSYVLVRHTVKNYASNTLVDLVSTEVISNIPCLIKYNGDLVAHTVCSLDGEMLDFAETFPQYVASDRQVVTVDIINLVSARFSDITTAGNFVAIDSDSIPIGGLAWIDSNAGVWSVMRRNGVSSFTSHRTQEPLLNTALLENSFIYDATTKNTIVRLPVYDPFKGIIPGVAEQNICYKTFNDPARYTTASETRLVDRNRLFGAKEVGKVWWDLNDIRYMYYEQPAAVGETSTDSLLYRRNQWGRMFQGSTVSLYEWTRSSAAPVDYSGEGTPRNTTDYVAVSEFNASIGEFSTAYYFWVSGKTSVPNIPNRTTSTRSLASLLVNPRSFGYEWFSAIQSTDGSDSYTFGNVERILSNNRSVIQINYRTTTDALSEHKQWKLLSEGSEDSYVPDQLWDKMVDSIVGTTDLVSLSEYTDAIPVNATHGVMLVPDPNLSEETKYGISFRPRQGMFVDVMEARRVLVQVLNRSLALEPTRDVDPMWNAGLATNTIWAYVDWYASGYSADNTVVSRQIGDTSDLAMVGDAHDGEVFKVLSFTPSVDDRAQYYVYSSSDGQFTLVRVEKASVQLLPTVYTKGDSTSSRAELRDFMFAVRKVLRVDNNKVFFAMVNFVFSEQSHIDWAFKTSYLYISQGQRAVNTSATANLPDQFDNVVAYIQEAKPYRSKVRNIVSGYGHVDNIRLSMADNAIGRYDEESNTWVSIYEYLRLFEIEIDLSGEGVTDDTSVDSLHFISDGWGGAPWDIFGWDDFSGYEDSIDSGSFSMTTVDSMDSGHFTNTWGTKEGLVPLAPTENIVFTVTTTDPLGTTQIEYKQHVTPFGYSDFVRMSGVENTESIGIVSADSTRIHVVDTSSLTRPSTLSSGAGVVWIDDERIEYYGVDGNYLVNIRRGTKGTPIVDHASGAKVYDGGNGQLIPSANDEWWVTDTNGIFESSSVQAIFLKSKPITP